MKKFKSIVQSDTQPGVNDIWVKDNQLLYHNKGGWQKLSVDPKEVPAVQDVLDELPTTDIIDGKIYLIKDKTGAYENAYTEYVHVDGKWEIVGESKKIFNLNSIKAFEDWATDTSKRKNIIDILNDFCNDLYSDGNRIMGTLVAEITKEERDLILQHDILLFYAGFNFVFYKYPVNTLPFTEGIPAYDMTLYKCSFPETPPYIDLILYIFNKDTYYTPKEGVRCQGYVQIPTNLESYSSFVFKETDFKLSGQDTYNNKYQYVKFSPTTFKTQFYVKVIKPDIIYFKPKNDSRKIALHKIGEDPLCYEGIAKVDFKDPSDIFSKLYRIEIQDYEWTLWKTSSLPYALYCEEPYSTVGVIYKDVSNDYTLKPLVYIPSTNGNIYVNDPRSINNRILKLFPTKAGSDRKDFKGEYTTYYPTLGGQEGSLTKYEGTQLYYLNYESTVIEKWATLSGFTDQDAGPLMTAACIKPLVDYTVQKANEAIEVPTKTSDLVNDSNFITGGDIPTKTSDLENDSDFITETTLNNKNYAVQGDLPTKTSELENDSDFITNTVLNSKNYVTSAQLPTKVSDLNNDMDFITNDDVPTKVSDLTNDTGFITSSALTNYATKTELQAKADSSAIPTKISDLEDDSNFVTESEVDTAISSNSTVTSLNTSVTALQSEWDTLNQPLMLTTEQVSTLNLNGSVTFTETVDTGNKLRTANFIELTNYGYILSKIMNDTNSKIFQMSLVQGAALVVVQLEVTMTNEVTINSSTLNFGNVSPASLTTLNERE